MQGLENSSDPSTSTSMLTSSARKKSQQNLVQPIDHINNPESEEKKPKTKSTKGVPIAHLVFSEILIPICLIFEAIATLSIVGMVIILVFFMHIYILNFSKKSSKGIIGITVIEMLIFILLLVFSAIVKHDPTKLPHAAVNIGFSFHSRVSKRADFGLASSIIGFIFTIIDFGLTAASDYPTIVKDRTKVFDSYIFKRLIYYLWYLCLAYIGASCTGYLFYPLLLFLCYTAITQSLYSQPALNIWIQRIVFVYAVLYSMFLIYQISPESVGPPVTWVLGFSIRSPRSADSFLSVVIVIFAYFSSLMSLSPIVKAQKVHEKLQIVADFIVEILLGLSILFAMFFPSLFAEVWILIPLISSFFPMKIIKSVFYRIHTVLFTLLFLAIMVTCTKNFVTPTTVETALGLFRYGHNFAFRCCGYFLVACLGQLGLYVVSNTHLGAFEEMDFSSSTESMETTSPDAATQRTDNETTTSKHAKHKHKKPRILDDSSSSDEDINANIEHVNDDEQNQMDDSSDDSEERKEKLKKERREKRKRKLEEIKAKLAAQKQHFHDVVLPKIKIVFTYLCLTGVIIVGIISGFFFDRWTLQVLCLVFMVVTLLGIYYRGLFAFLQLIVGLLIMVNVFFVAYPHDWDNHIDHFWEAGICPPNGMTVTRYMWPAYVLLILFAIIFQMNVDLTEPFSPRIGFALFLLDAVFHFLYVFIYNTSIFTLLYLLIGIGIICFVFTQQRQGMIAMTIFSCIFVTVQIITYMFSHFADIRNMIYAIIPYPTIIDIRTIQEHPTARAFILASILFLGSVSLRCGPIQPKAKLNTWDHIYFEIKLVSKNFYFYITWILVFGFSVVNHYPTFIKFLLSLLFIFGRYSAPLFDKIRLGFLIFSIVYLGCQVGWEVFYPLIHGLFHDYSVYLGLFLNKTHPMSKRTRNGPIGWQLAYIIVSAINIKRDKPRAQDEEFERKLPVRIYNAFCAFLHYFLPVIVEIALCISCLCNPSIFGYLSFIVMILVVFKPVTLVKNANLFLALFNLCFIVQYLLWLKCPSFLFDFHLYHIINKWGRFLGIVDVKVSSLIANCIAQIIFTFYIQFNLLFVDYAERFNDLPYLMKQILTYFVGYTFEIFMSFIVVILFCIHSFDGVFFIILISCLLTATLLYHFPALTTVNITSYYTFFVFGAHMLSRIPIFYDTGVGHYAREMFDLPFADGTAIYEVKWIFVFILERFMVHLMNSNLHKEALEMFTKHRAYRFLHSRQLKVIEKLDQEICTLRYNLDIKEIEALQSRDPASFFDGLRMTGKSNVIDMENKSMFIDEEEQNERKKHKVKWYNFFYLKILLPICDYFIETLASCIPPICEAGLNVLTLQTIQLMLKKEVRSLEIGRSYVPDKSEQQFFDQLPPSLLIRYDSLGAIKNFRYFESSQRWKVLGKYMLALCRRLAFPFLVLIVLIFTYMKPFLFGMFLIVYVVYIFCACRMTNEPNFYRVFFILVLTMLCFDCFSDMALIRGLIVNANNSIKVQKMNINIFSLFGLNPLDSRTIDIFVFLGAMWFVCDQLAYSEVFSSAWYLKEFSTVLPGFPVEYCYGIIANPVSEYALDVKQKGSFFKRQLKSLKLLGLRPTTHKYWLLLFDLVSLLVLAICWTRWTVKTTTIEGKDGTTDLTEFSGVVKLDVGYIFILLVHSLFTFVVYYSIVSYTFWLLYYTEELWFLYTILITFYYCHSATATLMPPTLQFYFCLRFISHLIASHQCIMARTVAVFIYPDFAHDSTIIIIKNAFMLYMPFALEFQMLLEWISKKTYVSLVDYFIVNELKAKLEMKVAQATHQSHHPEKKYKPRKRWLIGGIFLFLLACCIFIPLFFFLESSGDRYTNPPIFASFDIGITSLPSLFHSDGIIIPMTSSWLQEIADSHVSNLQPFIGLPLDTISVVDFPATTSVSFEIREEYKDALIDIVKSEAPLIPYIQYTFFFDLPTTACVNQQVIAKFTYPDLTASQRQFFLDILVNQTSLLMESLQFELPLTLFAVPKKVMGAVPGVTRYSFLHFTNQLDEISVETPDQTQQLQYRESEYFELDMIDQQTAVPFLYPDRYRVLLYSEPVPPGGYYGMRKHESSSAGVYVIIILILAFFIRYITLGLANDLWFKRMDQPQRLYRLSMAIELFRNANMPKEEKDMTDAMINTVRSHEMVLKVTSNDVPA